jgi:hypothetical protein
LERWRVGRNSGHVTNRKKSADAKVMAKEISGQGFFPPSYLGVLSRFSVNSRPPCKQRRNRGRSTESFPW